MASISLTAKDMIKMSVSELKDTAIQNTYHEGVFRSAPLKDEDNIFLHYELLHKYPDTYKELMQIFIAAKPRKEADSTIAHLLPPNAYDALSWIAVWCNEKKDNLETQEWFKKLIQDYLSKKHKEFSEKDEAGKRLHQSAFHHDFSAVLFNYSEDIRKSWAERYTQYIMPEGRINDLLSFLDLRYRWLGIDAKTSMDILYQYGFQPEDVFMAYLLKPSYAPCIQIDVVEKAVKDYPERALALLDVKNYGKHISIERYNSQRPSYMLTDWVDFLFRYCDVADYSFLKAQHKQKKMALHCSEILAEKENVNLALQRFEERLQIEGLLHSDDTIDFGNSKLLKRQRSTITEIYISHYQYCFDQWQKTFLDTAASDLVNSLIWGIYEQDKLKVSFMLDTDNSLKDNNSQLVIPKQTDKIGLIHVSELTSEEIKAWKKVLKLKALKQPFSQLTPVPELVPSELDGMIIKRFFGAVSKHITIVGTSGKWNMSSRNDSNYYSSYHMVDNLHKFGAQLSFDRIWSGPEYNSDDEVIRNAVFYTASDMPFGDVVPESKIVQPEVLPKRFVQIALQAFASVSGMK